MKSFLLILISAILLIPSPGCKKKSFDPSGKSREDFIGTWTGTISTFKNNQLLKVSGTLVIYPDAGNISLTGIFFMNETSVFHEFQFVDGTLYFKVVNNDPANPMCQNWSLGGYLVFSEENKIDIRISGNECGPQGTEYVNWTGSMIQTQVPADSIQYYNFAKSGNSWTYQVFLKNGDSCQVQKQISQESPMYLFDGTVTQTCGWAGQNMTFKWNVTPSDFSIIHDSTLCYLPFSFPIDAKPGVIYKPYTNNDTVTMTLLDSNFIMTIPAGTFSCKYFRYTEPVDSGLFRIKKTAYLWLNNRYGIIKHEVLNPVDTTDIRVQVITSKNF